MTIENIRKMAFELSPAEQYRLAFFIAENIGHELHVSAPNLNEDTERLVLEFANALAAKLARAEQKYGYTNGWLTQDWEAECRRHLLDHLEKGDPLDVAAYCAFMWARHWSTVTPKGQ